MSIEEVPLDTIGGDGNEINRPIGNRAGSEDRR
jgi:hypothetical protein